MALDIPALAKGGVDTAWSVIQSVLSDCTLRMNPSGVYDSAADTSAITWGATIPNLKAFLWDDKNLEKPATKTDELGRNILGITKRALLRSADIANAVVTTSAELDEGAITWYVTGVDTPPGGAIVILDLLR
jgi:hypothetical protein